MTGYCEPPVPPLKYDPDTLARMQALWEGSPELSATRIAERFPGMTKNAVIGQARRREWKPRRASATEPTTMQDRLDAHHARLDAVLAETRPFVDGRPKVLVPADARRAAA